MKKTSKNKLIYGRQALRDVKRLKRIARKMIAQMEGILKDKTRNASEEDRLFLGRYSMIASLNTLTNLTIALESREQMVMNASEGEMLPPIPMSEEDVRLLEHFIEKQEHS